MAKYLTFAVGNTANHEHRNSFTDSNHLLIEKFFIFVDELRLGIEYANEPEFALCVRMFWALSCCRPDDVKARFDLLQTSKYYDERLGPYCNYFMVNILAFVKNLGFPY